MAGGALLLIFGLGAAALVAANSGEAHAAPGQAGGGGTGPSGAIELDKAIDPETQRAVLQALQTETDPANLVRLAHAIGDKYPLSAAALIAKSAALQAAARGAEAAQAAAQGIAPATSTVATPAALMPPATTPPGTQPAVVPVPTFVPATPPPVATPAPAPGAGPSIAPASALPTVTGTPPTGAGAFVLASNADVTRDGVASRYASLLRQPVGTTVNDTYNGRQWQFRVISHQSEPALTTYAKDVKGWIWQPGAAGSSPVSSAIVPSVTAATIASAPNSNMTIAQVQQRLNALGVPSPLLVVDGKNGPKTTAAVKLFQMQQGLAVDGIAGPHTWAALANPSAPTPAVPLASAFTQASYGGHNPQPTPASQPPTAATVLPLSSVVTNKDVQSALNTLGTAPRLTVDGILGPLSTAAVKTFQAAHGLAVDGIAGPKTKAALSAALAGASGAVVAGWGRTPARPMPARGGIRRPPPLFRGAPHAPFYPGPASPFAYAPDASNPGDGDAGDGGADPGDGGDGGDGGDDAATAAGWRGPIGGGGARFHDRGWDRRDRGYDPTIAQNFFADPDAWPTADVAWNVPPGSPFAAVPPWPVPQPAIPNPPTGAPLWPPPATASGNGDGGDDGGDLGGGEFSATYAPWPPPAAAELVDLGDNVPRSSHAPPAAAAPRGRPAPPSGRTGPAPAPHGRPLPPPPRAPIGNQPGHRVVRPSAPVAPSPAAAAPPAVAAPAPATAGFPPFQIYYRRRQRRRRVA
jgi:peptidoglycan hydrolase-like protein with peptidoglycan-binding domain